MIYIVGGTRKEAISCANADGLKKGDWIPVETPNNLSRAGEGDFIVFCGNWYQIPRHILDDIVRISQNKKLTEVYK